MSFLGVHRVVGRGWGGVGEKEIEIDHVKKWVNFNLVDYVTQLGLSSFFFNESSEIH